MPNATVPVSGELPVPGDLRRRAAPPRPIGQKGRDRLVGRFSPCLSPLQNHTSHRKTCAGPCPRQAHSRRACRRGLRAQTISADRGSDESSPPPIIVAPALTSLSRLGLQSCPGLQRDRGGPQDCAVERHIWLRYACEAVACRAVACGAATPRPFRTSNGRGRPSRWCGALPRCLHRSSHHPSRRSAGRDL